MKQYQAILRIRAKSLEHIRFWLNNRGFTEVQGPLLAPVFGEKVGFEVNYNNKKLALSGALQPYSDSFLKMFKGIYALAPTFRQEPDETKRHLIEFWRVEVFANNLNFAKILGIQEELISFVISKLLDAVSTELVFLNGRGWLEKLKQVTPPFPRLTYDEAIVMLQESGCKIFWGERIDWSQERDLSKKFSKPFFITEFPLNGETYFHKTVKRKPELTLSCDLIAPDGFGEIASGGEILRQRKIVETKMKELEISPAAQEWYLNLRNFGSKPQTGFALGIERFLQWVCGLDNIKQTAPFGI